MALAFRHVETGTICTPDDAADYGAPDWEPLPDTPEGPGPWDWHGDNWIRNDAPAFVLLRSERDVRLLACDWTQLADVPEETRLAWQPYRQALRDMPETADPFAPEWPSPPAA